ncbi:MAG: PASTA domain-containing protein [Gemmatimonadales bacterium]
MRARRHTTPSIPLFKSGPWRTFLRDMGLIVATFIIGYGVSALWLSPGTVFSKDHSLPRLLELPEAQARRTLTDLGFRPRLDGERPSDSFPRGTVIWQDPAPGTVLQPNAAVQLVLSAGPTLVPVPDVIGMSLPQAAQIFAAAGVRFGTVDTVAGSQDRGVVLATRPGAGVGRPRGSSIVIVVSGGSGDSL